MIHKSRNDYEELCEYLLESSLLIGFNILGFDYPVLHIMIGEGDTNTEYISYTGDRLAKILYKRAQRVIDWNAPGKKREWFTPVVPICDVYKIWHFHNKARSTSLKWLQFCMGWPNLQEMPISHTEKVTAEMIPMILEYNENDVMSTNHFWELSKDKIEFREKMSAKYGADMSNYPDTKIGEKIFLKGLADLTDKSEREIAKGRTPRNWINISECLIDNIKFESPEFQDVLEQYKNMVITTTKKKQKEKPITCIFDNVKYDFGFGGLHALRRPGLYRDLVSIDVKSYYPNLSISNLLYPQHLGLEFVEVYKLLYNDRIKYPKGSPESEALKLALNGTFGASNAPWSPFYDPAFTMSVTCNGQFILAMLCERITLSGAGSIIISNTDGIECEVRDRQKLIDICKAWEEEFALTLEYAKYNKIAIGNVNNYIGVFTDGKVKEKGAYETNRPLYKNQSMKIVAQAVRKYFVDGIPPADTIRECNDIHQYLMGHRAKTGNLRYRHVVESDLLDEKLPKNVRYYISYTGGSIVKITKQEKKKKKTDPVISPRQTSMFGVTVNDEKVMIEKPTNLHVGRKMVLFNKMVDKPFDEYNVDKSFYVTEAKKMIDAVTKSQTPIDFSEYED